MRLPTLTLLLLAAAAAPASATQDVSYSAHYEAAGTWTESVRAGADESDSDGDGREEVSSRDQAMRFTLRASIPEVEFRDGALRERARSVDHRLGLEILSSTVTEPNGESGTCSVFDPGAGGSAELFRPGAGNLLVFRPADDVIFQASCRTPMLEWPFHMNAQQKRGLDIAFGTPDDELGAKRIELTGVRDPAVPCPVEDPGHTTACSFEWTGRVVLERLPGMIAMGTASRAGRFVRIPVECAERCRPVLTAGGARRRFDVTAGRTTLLKLPVGSAKPKRLTVRAGAVTRTFPIKKGSR